MNTTPHVIATHIGGGKFILTLDRTTMLDDGNEVSHEIIHGWCGDIFMRDYKYNVLRPMSRSYCVLFDQVNEWRSATNGPITIEQAMEFEEYDAFDEHACSRHVLNFREANT